MAGKSPSVSRLAAFLIGVLSASPFAIALDMWIGFIPDYPAVQAMRTAGLAAKAAWIALGPLGVVTIFLLVRRPELGFVLSVAFAGGMFFASLALWSQLVGGFWLAVAACVLAGVGAWFAARSNNSFKGMPLRGTP